MEEPEEPNPEPHLKTNTKSRSSAAPHGIKTTPVTTTPRIVPRVLLENTRPTPCPTSSGPSRPDSRAERHAKQGCRDQHQPKKHRHLQQLHEKNRPCSLRPSPEVSQTGRPYTGSAAKTARPTATSDQASHLSASRSFRSSLDTTRPPNARPANKVNMTLKDWEENQTQTPPSGSRPTRKAWRWHQKSLSRR